MIAIVSEILKKYEVLDLTFILFRSKYAGFHGCSLHGLDTRSIARRCDDDEPPPSDRISQQRSASRLTPLPLTKSHNNAQLQG